MTAAVAQAAARLQAQKLAQMAMLERQVLALRRLAQAPESVQQPTPDVLLTLYLDTHSAKAVAQFCTAQGWRLPGAKGPRCCTPEDVYQVIRGEQGAADEDLRAMARQMLDGADAGRAGRARFSGC